MPPCALFLFNSTIFNFFFFFFFDNFAAVLCGKYFTKCTKNKQNVRFLCICVGLVWHKCCFHTFFVECFGEVSGDVLSAKPSHKNSLWAFKAHFLQKGYLVLYGTVTMKSQTLQAYLRATVAWEIHITS